MAVVLALSSAVVYGASDFLGGLASRRASVYAVVAASQLIGLAALLALLPWLGGPVSSADLAWGAAAGLAGSVGLVVFFRTLAGGVMSVVAPVTAVTAAAVPVLVGLLGGETIGPWAAAGIALALVAVVLVSAEGGLAALRAARPAALAPRCSPARCSGSSSWRWTGRRRTRGSHRWWPPGSPRSPWSWSSPSPSGSPSA
ncbi:EamA family transporter [Blastococcus sp. SYSU D01042]